MFNCNTSEDTGNASDDNIDETPAQLNRNSLPPDTLWDGDISESTDAYPHPVIPIPPPLPVDKAVFMQKAKSTGSILRRNREKKRLTKRRSKSSTRTSEVSDRECMDDELSDEDCANSKRLFIRDSNNPTCSNIEVVPKRKKKKRIHIRCLKMMRLGILITTWKIEEVPVRQDMGHVLCRLQTCDIVVVRLQRSQPSRDQRLCVILCTV